MIITKQHLVAKNATIYQVKLFNKTFGEEFEVTLDNCLKAVAVGINLEWVAYYLFTDEQHEMYDTARDHLLATYQTACAPLLETYNKANSQLWKMYEKACSPLLETYKTACAKAFYEATLI